MAAAPRVTVTVTGSVGHGVDVLDAVGVTVTVIVGVMAHCAAEDDAGSATLIVAVSDTALEVSMATAEVEIDVLDAALFDVEVEITAELELETSDVTVAADVVVELDAAAAEVLTTAADEVLAAAPPVEPDSAIAKQLPNPGGLVTRNKQAFPDDPPVQTVPAGIAMVIGLSESAPPSPKSFEIVTGLKLLPVPVTSINAVPGPPPSEPALTCLQFIEIEPDASAVGNPA